MKCFVNCKENYLSKTVNDYVEDGVVYPVYICVECKRIKKNSIDEVGYNYQLEKWEIVQ